MTTQADARQTNQQEAVASDRCMCGHWPEEHELEPDGQTACAGCDASGQSPDGLCLHGRYEADGEGNPFLTTSPQADATASATTERALSLLAADIRSLDNFQVPVTRMSDEQLVRAIALCERELRRRKNR